MIDVATIYNDLIAEGRDKERGKCQIDAKHEAEPSERMHGFLGLWF